MSAAPRPVSLYKYRRLDLTDSRVLLDTILENKIWFASPISFNDPYDCIPVIDARGTKDDVVRWAWGMSRRHQHLNRQERREIARKMVDEILVEGPEIYFGRARGITAWHEVLREVGVYSLSDDPANILMWGHYADNHEGVCLKFDPSLIPFSESGAVRYSDDRPVFKVFPRNARRFDMEEVLLQKALCWSYEHEWRIISLKGPGIAVIPSNALTGIIVGARCPSARVGDLRAVLSKVDSKAQIFRAHLNTRKFELEILPAD